MAKRGKKKKRGADSNYFVAQSKVAQGSDQMYDVAFRVGEPIDMEEVARLRDELDQISEANFEFDEETELLLDLLNTVDPLIRGAMYLQMTELDGEPVVVEDEDTGDSYELTLVNGIVQKKKIQKAEFGVRDQKDNISHALDLAEPPAHLTAEEAELWKQSPAMVISEGLRRGDSRWQNFVGQIQGDIAEQQDQEETTIKNFFRVQEVVYHSATVKGARTRTDDGHDVDLDLQREARLAWAHLRNARVFHIDPSIYQEIYQACDRYCTEEISGLSYTVPKRQGSYYVYENIGDPDGPPDAETEHHIKTLRAASPTAPMPEKFPFEVMYLGYGPGVYLLPHQAEGKFAEQGKTVPPEVDKMYVIGAMITATGHVFEFYKIIEHGGAEGFVIEQLRRPEEGFVKTIDLAPWYIPKLVEFVASHKVFVLEQDLSDEQKRRARQVRKNTHKNYHRGMRWMPRPYYRIRMKDTVVKEKIESVFPRPGKARTYRTDVIGHDRHLVRRGLLPLDPAKREVLVKRGYQVFENTFPPSDLLQTLIEKGHQRKLPAEWMAVKEVWIDQHMNVNDESLPYVPAIRTTGSRRGGPQPPPPQGSSPSDS